MPSSVQSMAIPFIILVQLIFIAVTTLVLVLLLKFREGFAFHSAIVWKIIFHLHQFLMVVGFILFGRQAIMAFKMIPAKRIHLLLHPIALGSGILATIVIFKFKDETNHLDLYTLHAWLGIIAICASGLQYIVGFLAYFFPGAKMSARATLLQWHRSLGLVIFVLAVCTAITGLVERFLILNLRRQQEALIVNFTGLLIFLFGAIVSLVVIFPS